MRTILLICFLVTGLLGCGGGGTNTTYQIIFSGTVSGLQTGQSVTLSGVLATTGQTLPITISQNGSFNSTLVLPAGFDLSTAGTAAVTVSKQPSSGNCTVSFVSTSSITVVCTATATAAGYYVGSQTVSGVTSTVNYAKLFIKNNGEYWLRSYINSGQTASVQGLFYGNGTSSNGSYTSTSGIDVFSATKSVATLRGTYVSNTSFDSTATSGGATISGKLAIPSPTTYSFITSPTLTAISGNYNFSFATTAGAQTLTLSVTSTGALSGATTGGCVITGNVSPMTTGENAYDISIIYGAAPCISPNVINTGFAVIEMNAAGTQISGGALNSGKNDGLLFLGTKL